MKLFLASISFLTSESFLYKSFILFKNSSSIFFIYSSNFWISLLPSTVYYFKIFSASSIFFIASIIITSIYFASYRCSKWSSFSQRQQKITFLSHSVNKQLKSLSLLCFSHYMKPNSGIDLTCSLCFLCFDSDDISLLYLNQKSN